MVAILLSVITLLAGQSDRTSSGILVELFTSQGCSSCPPADALLSELGKDQRLAGRIVPLTFHVDYWDFIGWKDPFSSSEWSARQRQYARVLNPGQVYTPQIVVAGARQVVGNDGRAVRRAIEAALSQRPEATISILPGRQDDKVSVSIDASLQRSAIPGEVFVALYENGTSTRVRNGENGGRVLRNDFVVRKLVRVASIQPGKLVSTTALVDVPSDSKPAGVAAFIQDSRSLRIIAASSAQLP